MSRVDKIIAWVISVIGLPLAGLGVAHGLFGKSATAYAIGLAIGLVASPFAARLMTAGDKPNA